MIPRFLKGHARRLRSWLHGGDASERVLELLGRMLAREVADRSDVASLREVEFRVFSQWGDDGIIQWLISQIPGIPGRFVEFGVEDYSESNTRFLMVNDNWRGLVMDGSRSNIANLRRHDWFWRYDLTALDLFVTRDNVDATIASWAAGEPVGLLHIDVDGNDYWLWQAIECIAPTIAIVEYNATFGRDRPISVPYRPDFDRLRAHASGLYFGASLAALTHLATRKGYALVGVNSAANNVYFVRRESLSGAIREVSVQNVFAVPAFRDSRNAKGELNYLSHAQRQEAIRGLPVINVVNGELESF